MKRVLLSSVLVLTAAAAAAADGVYVEGNVGYSTPSDAEVSGMTVGLGDGVVGGGAVGYGEDWWRVELNGSFRNLEIEKIKTQPMTKTVNVKGRSVSVNVPRQKIDGDGEASAIVGLVNVYLDHDVGLVVRPYVGGGVGVSYVQMESYGQSMSTPAFTWDVAGGVAYDVTEHVTVGVGYRYLRLEGSDFMGIGDSDIEDVGCHEFLVGIRYTF